MVEDKHDEFMQLLNQNKEYAKIIGPHKSTLLHKAVYHKRAWSIKTLLDNGCPPELKNSKGYTCLELAVMADTSNIMEELLHCGNFESSELKKLTDLANQLKRVEILNMLSPKAESEENNRSDETVQNENIIEDGEILEEEDNVDSKTKRGFAAMNFFL